MDKAKLKRLAFKARTELYSRIEMEARKLEITETSEEQVLVESSDAIFIGDRQLSSVEKKQRDRLLQRIQSVGLSQVLDEITYTWFNRLVAFRFMEVNDYIPTRVRVLSSADPDEHIPDMIRYALELDLPIDHEYVYELRVKNRLDELFKYMLLAHCKELSRSMPFMFPEDDDYTTLLFPEGLLNQDSFLRKMTDPTWIKEEDWEQVEIIGWLYQFYIAHEKDLVFKKRGKYEKKEIAYATQIFTPHWIVQYMVQNSLGKYWVEMYPEHRDLIDGWEYFITDETSSTEQKEKVSVEVIKCFDPAMGSGHILLYMFDLLYEIYQKCGYVEQEIPHFILQNNLYGLDIDERAYQLAAFSLVMKALSYHRNFLQEIEEKGLQLQLLAIEETNALLKDVIQFLAEEEKGSSIAAITEYVEQFKDARAIGSLLKVDRAKEGIVREKFEKISEKLEQNLFDDWKRNLLQEIIPKLFHQSKILTETYDIVVTNPPYMNPNKHPALNAYVRKHYPDSKTDLFAVFMELGQNLTANGFYAVINQHSWMFLSSYEDLRKKIIKTRTIDTMLHLGTNAFEEIGGEVVQSTAFVMRNKRILGKKGTYIRLVSERSSKRKDEKARQAVKNPDVPYRYTFLQEHAGEIPGNPLGYWLTDRQVERIFHHAYKFSEIAHAFQGMITGNNKKYLRYWFELPIDEIGFHYKRMNEFLADHKKWVPYHKGGSYRKWYGNHEHVLYWMEDGKHLTRARSNNKQFYLQEGITWSYLTTTNFSARYFGEGFLWDVSGSSLFSTSDACSIEEIVAFMNSKPAQFILNLYNPTLNYQVEDILNLPYKKGDKETTAEIVERTKENIEIAKNEWDSFEISWDFKKHPILNFSSDTMEGSFDEWNRFTTEQFQRLKENEEILNDIFIKRYGLEEEMVATLKDEEVTFRKADLKREVKSFLSYAIGCMFGRYSLDEEGLVFAGGDFNPNRYKTFPVQADNFVPILDQAFYEEDIVVKFEQFLKTVYPAEHLEENLSYIANILGKREHETDRETIRRYFLMEFYPDHRKIYKGHPIYWYITSGRERAFNGLFYYHRFDEKMLPNLRDKYVFPLLTHYYALKNELEENIGREKSSHEIRKLERQLRSAEKKRMELQAFDEKLRDFIDRKIHLDFDQGIRANFVLLEELLLRR